MTKFRGYQVRWEQVAVAGQTYELLMPVAPDDLVDDPRVAARFARDEYLPYWARLWPAARLLAEQVAAWPVESDRSISPTVLEIGCGLGLVGLVALRRGYRVTCSDYDEDALAFTCASAARNGLTEPGIRLLDWRQEYTDLRPQRILAADILYESRNLVPVAQFLRTHLAAGGYALLSDPGRSTADAFAATAAAAGLAVVERPMTLPAAAHTTGPCGAGSGRIFELRRIASIPSERRRWTAG